MDDFSACIYEPFLLGPRLGLLPCGDHGDGDGEDLRYRSCHGSEGEFYSCARGLRQSLRGDVERANDGVPVKVSEIRGSNADKRAIDAGIQPQESVILVYLVYGV